MTDVCIRLHRSLIVAAVLSAAFASAAQFATAQDAAQGGTAELEAPKIPEIVDEPRTVDPATILPAAVVKPATVTFEETSLRDVAAWLQNEAGIPVFIDNAAIRDAGLLATEPVTDQLQNEPIYFLLDRLRLLDLVWFIEDNVVRITTNEMASDPQQFQTAPYAVGDLFDAGYSAGRVIDAIRLVADVDWEEVDGVGGSIESLGDVLFVRQTRAGHRQIKGLLTALRKHARQTFAFEPPQHQALRGKLEEPITVAFRDSPLKLAIADLSEQTKVDIRLDPVELKSAGVRDREQVSLALNDRPLRTVLELLLNKLDLTWSVREGVIWITSIDGAESHLKCAVYDVRDLCRDNTEANGLVNAIFTQTAAEWQETGGAGGEIEFPQPGVMVVLQTEKGHEQVLDLLTAYRQALLASKIRKRSDPGSEVSVRYYQMQQQIAKVVAEYLMQTVAPESWRADDRPEAPGTILHLPSNASAIAVAPSADGQKIGGSATIVLQQSVLVIRQTRDNHEEIAKILRRVQHGDQPLQSGQGGSMGGGGFGGGYFSVKPPAGTVIER